ncbi:MAG TPA: hypothetical protein PLK12_01580 [Prolixibacteraceae bacterium]|nr:hypothetical protein [Prolixibacteraceae bacterium]
MRQFIVFSTLFLIISLNRTLRAQVIVWEENFPFAEKGIWPVPGGEMHTDLSGVDWYLDASASRFPDEKAWVKTVATDGGRFETMASYGDVYWYSPVLPIAEYDVVRVSLWVKETGSGSNSTKKYVRACYSLNGGAFSPFETDSLAEGNWGEMQLKQNGLQGTTVQLCLVLNASYTSDKVIVDEIRVEGIDSLMLQPCGVQWLSRPSFVVLGESFTVRAAGINALGEQVNDPGFSLSLLGEGIELASDNVPDGICSWTVRCNRAGRISLKISSNYPNIEPATGQITVFKPEDLIVWEDFEDSSLKNWDDSYQWTSDSLVPLSGFFSARHLEQSENGWSKLSYIALSKEIKTGISELLISWKTGNGSWNPSASNFFYLRLGKESINHGDPFFNGIAFGVNAKGSTDRVSVWESDGNGALSLLEESAFTWAENTRAQIDLLLQPGGLCTLIVTNLFGYQKEEASFTCLLNESITDIDFIFGYSKTRSGQLWFDDFVVAARNTPPLVLSVQAEAEGQLRVRFNEPLEPGCPGVSDFEVTGKSGRLYPVNSVERIDSVSIRIFTGALEEPELVLCVSGVRDREGAASLPASFDFLYLLPVGAFDVVFTEIMADPSPPVALPELEYLELYNQSQKYIDTEDWRLIVKTGEFALPGELLPPGGYLLLCPMADTAAFSAMGRVCGLPRFPSLLNSGTDIKITDGEGRMIDALSYSDDWYADGLKADGGWSLEKIDPRRNCGNRSNWKASVDPSGGTPGRKNSVDAENTDRIAPSLCSLEVVSRIRVDALFSEALDTLPFRRTNVSAAGLGIEALVPRDKGFSVAVYFDRPLKTNWEYALSFKELSDECGNEAPKITGHFMIPEIHEGDVVINEVLFNPRPGGSDFVELMNISGLTLECSKLYLATRNDTFGLRSLIPLSNEPTPFYDQNIVAFTANRDDLLAAYPVPYPDHIVALERMPAFPNTEGRVVLLDDSLRVIDELAYSEKQHSVWLDNCKGVSLERVSVERETSETSNWHSASSLCGYATPGYENSQQEIPEERSLDVRLESDVLSPNGDGLNDELRITFQTDQPDYLANVFVFDGSGREVCRLLNNQLPGNGSSILYEGRNMSGGLLNPGIYILLTELFHSSGKKKTFQHAFLVTDRRTGE